MSWRDRARKVEVKPKQGSWRDRARKVENWVNEVTTTDQVQHPDIATTDRLIAKNFAQDQGKQLEFFKQKYPGLEFDVAQATGQIRVKKPDEKNWQVIDPDTGFFSSDILKDTGDIGFDLLAAGTEGAATTGAALASGPAAIPAAMGAGAATTAGNEFIRQKLGSYLGIPQEVDMTDVGVAAGVGAAAPLAFGAGKARGLVEMGTGAVGRQIGKMNPLPWLGEKVSGIPRQVLRDYADDGVRETVKRLEREGVSDYTGQVFDKLKGYIEGRKDKAGEELVKAIEGAGRPVNLKGAKAAFETPMNRLSSQEIMTPADVKVYDTIEGTYRNYLGLDDGDNFIPDDIPATRAWDIQKRLKKAADFERDIKPWEFEAKQAPKASYAEINKALDKASDGLSSKAKQQYRAAIQEEAELLPRFQGRTRADSIQKTYNEMSRLDRQGRKVMQEKLSKLSDDEILNLADEARVLSTYRWLGNPNIAPVSSGGTTSTSRTIPLAIAGGSLGSLAGYNMGGGYAGATVGGAGGAMMGTILGSPAAMKAYIRAMRRAGRSAELVTPRDQNVWRGVKNAIAIEGATNPE